jgi:predicted DNA-binding protein (MmcQ/YjbR family)
MTVFDKTAARGPRSVAAMDHRHAHARIRALCLGLPGAVETFPFEPEVAVFKAPNGKMFAVLTSAHVSLKCDPDLAADLRRDRESIIEGYHLNKRHWITILHGGDAPDDLVEQLIEDSFALVATARRAARTSAPASAR